MRNQLILCCVTLLLAIPFCQAESRHYQTAPPGEQIAPHGEMAAPFIVVDPEHNDRRVYLTLEPSTQPQVAIAHYSEPTQLHQAIETLYQQLQEACPQGWVKHGEWAIAESATIALHYAFTCIDP